MSNLKNAFSINIKVKSYILWGDNMESKNNKPITNTNKHTTLEIKNQRQIRLDGVNEVKRTNNETNRKFALELLDKYGLGEFKKYYPDQLSGGMRQRVALIRTLVSDPKILLLDEPFSALDSQTRLSVCDDVFSIIKAEQKTAVLVTHDISEAISMSDKIIVLTDRPAKVKSIFRPNLKGNTPLRRRESADFGVWFEKIWKELH